MKRRTFLGFFGLGAFLPHQGFAKPEYPYPNIGQGTHFQNSGFRRLQTEGLWPQISLVAIGGVGIAMARHIDKAHYGLHEIIAIDTSDRSLRSAVNADKLLRIKTDNGSKPETADDGWHWALERSALIDTTIGNPHMVILVVGLGGAAGTGIANVAARVAQEKGILTVAYATTPFGFESERRLVDGEGGFIGLTMFCHNTCRFSLGKAATAFGEDARFANTVSQAKTALGHYLWNTAGCLAKSGLVGIDLEDVRFVLDCGQEEGFNLYSTIAWGSAGGVGRAKVATMKALECGIFVSENQRKIQTASVSVRANRGTLRMEEVNEAMNTTKAYFDDSSTHILFSADYDDSLADWMEVSVLLNGNHLRLR